MTWIKIVVLIDLIAVTLEGCWFWKRQKDLEECMRDLETNREMEKEKRCSLTGIVMFFF